MYYNIKKIFKGVFIMKITDLEINDYSSLPKRVMQFGEGNFLRAFADYFIQNANEQGIINSSVVLVKPIAGTPNPDFKKQNFRYNVFLRGRMNGEVVDDVKTITSVSDLLSAYDDFDKLKELAKSPELRFVISNTTEAGIEFNSADEFSAVPNVTYPGKLTALLYERFNALGNDGKIMVLPVELIENNGVALKKCILAYADLWELGEDFKAYVNNTCIICTTLVDRIVTGFPANYYDALCERLGYEDKIMVACEPYYSWIISAGGREEEAKELFPLHKVFDNIVWSDDVAAYRERKVRILNGAHTVSVLAGYLAGYDIVRDMLHDEAFSGLINLCLNNEVIPTIDLSEDVLKSFATSVLERFDNPFIDHKLLDISLNSVSKFKARCMGSFKDYYAKTGKAPSLLSFGLAALIAFYNGRFEGDAFIGTRENGDDYQIKDNPEVLAAVSEAYKTADPVEAIMKNTALWGEDLTAIEGFEAKVKSYFDGIKELGVKAQLEKVINDEYAV